MNIAKPGAEVKADSSPRTGAADRRGRFAAWGRGAAVSLALSAVLATASPPTPAAYVAAPGVARVFPASTLCVGGSDQVQATPAQQKRARRKQWARLHRGGEPGEGDAGRATPDGR